MLQFGIRHCHNSDIIARQRSPNSKEPIMIDLSRRQFAAAASPPEAASIAPAAVRPGQLAELRGTTLRSREAARDHGWIFDVPARHRGLVKPEPLTQLGRFSTRRRRPIRPTDSVPDRRPSITTRFGGFHEQLQLSRPLCRQYHGGSLGPSDRLRGQNGQQDQPSEGRHSGREGFTFARLNADTELAGHVFRRMVR